MSPLLKIKHKKKKYTTIVFTVIILTALTTICVPNILIISQKLLLNKIKPKVFLRFKIVSK